MRASPTLSRPYSNTARSARHSLDAGDDLDSQDSALMLSAPLTQPLVLWVPHHTPFGVINSVEPHPSASLYHTGSCSAAPILFLGQFLLQDPTPPPFFTTFWGFLTPKRITHAGGALAISAEKYQKTRNRPGKDDSPLQRLSHLPCSRVFYGPILSLLSSRNTARARTLPTALP